MVRYLLCDSVNVENRTMDVITQSDIYMERRYSLKGRMIRVFCGCFVQISLQYPAYRVEISEKYGELSCQNIGRTRRPVVSNIGKIPCNIAPIISVQYREILYQISIERQSTKAPKYQQRAEAYRVKYSYRHWPMLQKCPYSTEKFCAKISLGHRNLS